jgi:hypothetical protein
MKRTNFYIIAAVFISISVSGLFGVGEKTITIGAAAGWRAMETRTGLAEIFQLRPYPVMALSSAGAAFSSVPDLYLSFDEGSPGRFRDQYGHYDVAVSAALGSAGESARRGSGAASFQGAENLRYPILAETVSNSSEGPLVIRPRQGALLSPGNHIRNFSIEFWLCPASLENGEQILAWSSVYPQGQGNYIFQRILCTVSRNRLQWSFSNFFFDPVGNIPAKNTYTLTGPPILPRTWSHHLIRFNADLGILEYLIDGRLEALDYITSTGRERGEVYTPVIGQDSSLVLGGRFTGLMDEFRIYSQYLDNPLITRYAQQGGRAESQTLDMQSIQSRLVMLEARGGKVSGPGNTRNDYAGRESFRFEDYSELRFYIRLSNNPYQWNDKPWIPVQPWALLPETYTGRYVQVAVEFFPSADGEATPYLEELNIVYRTADSVPPPSLVTAQARDGAVELSWRSVADSNLGGYMVYFGTSQETYFGAAGISSPLDAGNRTSIRIDGLQNGTLYFFTVASYDRVYGIAGDFSREVAARPMREFPAGP